MPVTYINRKELTYYLHIGKTSTGKDKYYFSTKSDGTLAETIPDGYEIYENPNAQVFLRIIQPKLITDMERTVVETGMEKYSKEKDYKIDIKKEIITIYIADQDKNILSDLVQSALPNKSKETIAKIFEREITYSPMLRFILTDEEKREFITQRYSFIGTTDDWIYIGRPDSLENLVKKFVKHLGQESLYDFLPSM
ncbi:MAG: hypothetical protein AB1847_14075 [bacterium]